MHTLTVTFTDGTHHRSHHDNDTSALDTLTPIVQAREAEIAHVDLNPYGMAPILPGTRVEILERGSWVGPFTVTDKPGRTPDHLVLSNGSWVVFEHYADPYNTRTAVA